MKGYENIVETTRKTISHSVSQNRRLKAQGATFQAFVDRVPPSEIIIERNNFYHRWEMYFSEMGRCAILDKNNREFPDYTDPMIVSLWLRAKAAGPINVVWNL